MSYPVPVDQDVGFRVRRLMRPNHDAEAWRDAFDSLPAGEAVPVLLAILSDPAEDERQREMAAAFLPELAGDRAVPALAQAAAGAGPPLVRARALLSLAAVGLRTPEAAAAVAGALADADLLVRDAAARAAASLHLEEAVEVLRRMVAADPAENVRDAAASAVTTITGAA
jgi:HEAT repeat protein